MDDIKQMALDVQWEADHRPALLTISVLMPTRGRPDKAMRAIRSLMTEDGRIPAGVEIIVGMDSDDPTVPELSSCLVPLLTGRGILPVLAPRHPTIGTLINSLTGHATGDILMMFADDATIGLADWPDRVRSIHTDPRVPPHAVIALHDPMHWGFTSYPCVKRAMVEKVGFMAAPWFPFWWCDTWWDEIATFTNARYGVEVGLEHPDGRGLTQSMRDLEFWRDFFIARRGERAYAASSLLKNGSEEWRQFHRDFSQRHQNCVSRLAVFFDPEFIRQTEGKSDGPPSPRYREALADAFRSLGEIGSVGRDVIAKHKHLMEVS